ncbi:MAG: HEAT repeat domain-containing protein, partial [Planctomycetales bacterium]
MSADPAQWVGAIDALDWSIHHQGTVYSSTPHAVPFLLRLLDSPGIKCRARILELVAAIAQGCSYLEVHGSLSHYDDTRETPEYQAKQALEMLWVSDTKTAVWNGLDVFLRLLSDFDKRIRLSVSYALGRLCHGEFSRREEVNKIVQSLRRQLSEEPNELVKAGLVFSLSETLEQDAIPDLREQLASPSSPQVKLAAAMCIVENEADPSTTSIQTVADALAHADEIDQIFTADEQSVEDRHHPLYKAYSEIDLPIVETVGSEYAGEDSGSEEDFRFPWFDCRVRFTLISSLCKLDLKHLPQIQSSLLSALRQEPPYTADVVSSPILRFLFARKKLPKKAT